MTPDLFKQIKQSFQRPFEEECGLIVEIQGKQDFWLCRNIWPKKGEAFVIHPRDWQLAEKAGKILAVVHSHVDGDLEPTESDWEGVHKSSKTGYIVSPQDWTMTRMDTPAVYSKILGREFKWGEADCYSLMRDWHFKNHHILLRDYPRDELFFKHSNPFEDLASKEGFVQVTDYREGNVVLFTIGSDNVNHCALIENEGHMLHHVENCFSKRDLFSGPWQKRVKAVYRHKELL